MLESLINNKYFFAEENEDVRVYESFEQLVKQSIFHEEYKETELHKDQKIKFCEVLIRIIRHFNQLAIAPEFVAERIFDKRRLSMQADD